MNKHDRIKARSIESRHNRTIFSDEHRKQYDFFIETYNKDIFTFCGSAVNVIMDANSLDAFKTFRLYEDGKFKHKDFINTSEPELLFKAITAKKAMGLWFDEYARGIAEGLFTKLEILEQFNDIKIPDAFLNDFNNRIFKFKFNA
jgi:hypothetical protein